MSKLLVNKKVMQNKKIIIGFVVLALVSFYAGMRYGGNNVRAAITSRSQNNSGGMRNRGGFTSGEILSMDAQSFTIKLNTGSKIVFYTDQTAISKMVDGTLADLAVGKQVSIMGTPNPDGSLNADSVQLRNTPAVK